MSQRKVSFAPGEYYHLYNRGNSKQQIFHDTQDYERFIGLLFLANASNPFNTFNICKDKNLFESDRDKTLVAIGAYTLMPNHFHILLRVLQDGSVSTCMQKLATGYSMYYNKKYNRTGSLFEGKFKAEHVHNDRYLKYMFSYIHLNPLNLFNPKWRDFGIKDTPKAFEFLDTYTYSSYLDYMGKIRPQSVILSRKDFPDYFPTSSSMKKELMTWITYND